MIAVTCAVFAVLLVLAVPVAFTIGTAGFDGLWWNGSRRLNLCSMMRWSVLSRSVTPGFNRHAERIPLYCTKSVPWSRTTVRTAQKIGRRPLLRN